MSAIYVVAGQSNANNTFDEIRAALRARDPGCTVIEVAAPGAPLTWARGDLDWYRSGELPQMFVDQVADLMRADPRAELAGVIWVQGEADTLDVARTNIYADQLSGLLGGIVRDLRSALPGRSADSFDFALLNVALSAYCPEATGRENWSAIQREQLVATTSWADGHLISMDLLARLAGIAPDRMFRDNLHYSQPLVNALATAVADWFGSGQSPLTAAIASVTRLGSSGADHLGAAPSEARTRSGDSTNYVFVGYDGNDIYEVPSSQTLVVELPRQGWDRVNLACDYDLSRWAEGVEELAILGPVGRSVTGNALSNRMFGSPGNDTIAGGAGDDTLFGGRGGDRLIGGAGIDQLQYGLATAGVTVDLQFSGANTGEAAGDSYSGIESLNGSVHADGLRGDATDNRIWGWTGADTLIGRGGGDTLLGGPGDDLLVGGPGADQLVGAGGIDQAQYHAAAAGIIADLQDAAQNTGEAAGDSYSSIENLFGTAHGDDLRGDGGANTLWGYSGNDVLQGRDGADNLSGGAGADRLYGGTGSDQLWGDQGADTLSGDGGDDFLFGGGGDDQLSGDRGADVLIGGGGADRLYGGGGTDRAQYHAAAAGIVADLQDATANRGEAAGDTYSSVEDVFGSAHDDDLRGDAGANGLWGHQGNDVLRGRGGNDTILGGGGNDRLYGGDGNDLLAGGAGADSFVFDSIRGGIDVIADFNRLNGGRDEGDVLRFEGLFDGPGRGGFAYLGSGSFSGGSDNAEARVAGNRVLVDTDGDGTAEITIILTGLTNPDQLDAGDFIFV
ncbi:MAG: hypothetical protein IAE87_18465 [Rhodobacteraceae bacterium]|jgi:Ca2+-binding RTX toxin-like protein|nr:hypothetical protein [Paracoccaceae bacterium]